MKIRKVITLEKENYTAILGSGYPVIRVNQITGEHINCIQIASGKRDSFVVISEEEAIHLIEMYNSISIDSVPVEDKEFVCMREDTGEPKHGISAFDIKEVLFHYKIKNTAFEAYKCPKCLKYHLGKTLNPQQQISVYNPKAEIVNSFPAGVGMV